MSFFASVIVLICLVGLLGNLSILVVIGANKLLRLQPPNLFLFSMCLSDFLNLLVNPVLYLYKQPVLFRFYYLDAFFCNVTPFLIGEVVSELMYKVRMASNCYFSSQSHACQCVEPHRHQRQQIRRNRFTWEGSFEVKYLLK